MTVVVVAVESVLCLLACVALAMVAGEIAGEIAYVVRGWQSGEHEGPKP